MKKKTVWITATILALCLVAVVPALAMAPKPILIEGTIADEQGNAMNGVSAYVSFSRRRGENHCFSIQDFEETVDSSFHYEGRGDGVVVIFSKRGYAPDIRLLPRDGSGKLTPGNTHGGKKHATNKLR